MPPANKKKYHAKKGGKSSQQRSSRPQGGGRGGGGGGPRKKNYLPNKKFPLTTNRRGGPGMLLTCESGREAQCCREGLQILQHYYEQQQNHDDDDDDNKDLSNVKRTTAETKTTLTLDEEIAMLQQQNSSATSAKSTAPFAMYETGCRGTVFLICTLPGCALIPLSLLQQRSKASQGQMKDNNDNEEENEDKVASAKHPDSETPTMESGQKRPAEQLDKPDDLRNDAENASKKRRTDDDPQTSSALELAVTTSPSPPPPWDPIATIHSIIQDLSPTTPTRSLSVEPPPSSRFVTRMIPMQSTCYASTEEIRILGRALIQRYLNNWQTTNNDASNSQRTPPQTFSIAVRRRICSNVNRDEIIDVLATAVMESTIPMTSSNEDCPKPVDQTDTPSPCKWKVDLKNPDMIVQVEICKTLCGIVILSGHLDRTLYHNFNLIEIRTENQPEPAASATST